MKSLIDINLTDCSSHYPLLVVAPPPSRGSGTILDTYCGGGYSGAGTLGRYPGQVRLALNMLLQATMIRNYFVKTQTSMASFGPPDLSIIFSNGMYLEVSPL